MSKCSSLLNVIVKTNAKRKVPSIQYDSKYVKCKILSSEIAEDKCIIP